MISNPALRYHTSPVRHVCIVSEGQNTRGRELVWEKGFGPWVGGIRRGPGLLTIAGQAMDEDDAKDASQSD